MEDMRILHAADKHTHGMRPDSDLNVPNSLPNRLLTAQPPWATRLPEVSALLPPPMPPLAARRSLRLVGRRAAHPSRRRATPTRRQQRALTAEVAVPSAGEAQPTGCDGSRERKSARERRVSARCAGSARMESRHAARRKTGSWSARSGQGEDRALPTKAAREGLPGPAAKQPGSGAWEDEGGEGRCRDGPKCAKGLELAPVDRRVALLLPARSDQQLGCSWRIGSDFWRFSLFVARRRRNPREISHRPTCP